MTKRNGLCCAAVLLLLLALLSVAVCGDAREQEALNGVTEMGIQRTPCYGSCPVYSATIAADGTIHYTGIRNVRRTGDHTAKVSAEKFRGLARFLLEKGFPGLKDD